MMREAIRRGHSRAIRAHGTLVSHVTADDALGTRLGDCLIARCEAASFAHKRGDLRAHLGGHQKRSLVDASLMRVTSSKAALSGNQWQLTTLTWRVTSSKAALSGNQWQLTTLTWRVTSSKAALSGNQWQLTTLTWRVTSSKAARDRISSSTRAARTCGEAQGAVVSTCMQGEIASRARPAPRAPPSRPRDHRCSVARSSRSDRRHRRHRRFLLRRCRRPQHRRCCLHRRCCSHHRCCSRPGPQPVRV